MVDIERTLKELVIYYDVTKRSGHTRAMLEGAKNSDCLVVVPSLASGKFLVKLGIPKERIVSLEDLSRQLRGRRTPLAWDNYALVSLLRCVLQELRRVKDEGRAARDAMVRINELSRVDR